MPNATENKSRRPPKLEKKSGRPPKFREPSRPVTVTLPESALARLAAIDSDRARAIVKATDVAMPLDGKPRTQVEQVEIMPGLSIILLGPSRSLKKIKWLRLVEVAPTRFLLVIPSGTSIDSLEVAIIDLLDKAEWHNPWERSLLERLRDMIRTLRREGRLSKAELLFIDTRSSR